MLPAAVQILAFVLALLGVLGATVATLLPNWKVSGTAWSSLMTPVSQMQGLWMDCVWYSSGVFSCTVKSSMLSLPPHLQATRAAMVLSCVVASLGLCLASLGLKCTRWGGGRTAKGRTAVAAGACFVLASFMVLVPASWFTNEVISAFLTTDLPDSSKYQPGGALCVTFISAGFLLAGGVIFCLSCPGKRSRSGRLDWASSSAADPDRPECQRRRGLRAERQTRPIKAPQQQENEEPSEKRDHKLYVSPSKPALKDIKDSYSLQEYV